MLGCYLTCPSKIPTLHTFLKEIAVALPKDFTNQSYNNNNNGRLISFVVVHWSSCFLVKAYSQKKFPGLLILVKTMAPIDYNF